MVLERPGVEPVADPAAARRDGPRLRDDDYSFWLRVAGRYPEHRTRIDEIRPPEVS